MAASPISISSPASASSSVNRRRRPMALTPRRLEANRRNAARSTGPRTQAGKARVARNAVKHGFFVAQQRWSPGQQRDFDELLAGLRDDFAPQSPAEESRVATIAESYIRMAALLRYENIAALEYHQRQEREMNERIAAASTAEAAQLEASREELRRAGLWRPILPGPRETAAIIRYQGSLDRNIHRTFAELAELKKLRFGAHPLKQKTQKQTHFKGSPRSGPEAAEGPPMARTPFEEAQKQTHFDEVEENADTEKTNPLNPMFMGNRHERRRAKALAKRHRRDP